MDGNFQLSRKPTAKERLGEEVLSPLEGSIFSPSASELALWGSNQETEKFANKKDNKKEVSKYREITKIFIIILVISALLSLFLTVMKTIKIANSKPTPTTREPTTTRIATLKTVFL